MSHGTRTTFSDEQLRKLFNLLNDGIVVMDRYRLITFINPAAERMTGWRQGEIVPYCYYCAHRAVEEGEERCYLASEKAVHYFESEMPTAWGEWIPVGMSRSFLHEQAPDAGHMVITIRDVTIERQAQALALRSEVNRRTIEAQEEERKRISQELHDGILQMLYGVRLGLEEVRLVHPETDDALSPVLDLLASSVKEIRHLSQSLYPAVLYDLGLVEALKQLIRQMSSSAQTVTLKVASSFAALDDTNRESQNSAHVYRIVQEALHNAIQHGQANHIDVSLGYEQGHVVLEVRDNGNGFNTSEKQKGYGLRNMEERAMALGGELHLWSEQGQGTVVRLTYPLSSSPDHILASWGEVTEDGTDTHRG